MPKIYLSPSTQDWNMYVTGSGSEEYNMNLLADALEPYLLSNGIQYQRNRPEMTAGSSIREANSGSMTCIWRCTPTPPQRGAMARNGALLPSITPAAWAVSGPRADRQGAAGDLSIAQQGHHPPYHLTGRGVASPGSRRCWWRSATTTTIAMPSGWRATWRMPSPSSLPGR